MESLQTEIVNIATMIIVALAGVVARSIVSYLKKKGVLKQIENNKAIVKTSVKAVQQIYKDKLNGEQKMDAVVNEAQKIMFKHGIKITNDEIKILAESVVREVKIEAMKATKTP